MLNPLDPNLSHSAYGKTGTLMAMTNRGMTSSQFRITLDKYRGTNPAMLAMLLQASYVDDSPYAIVDEWPMFHAARHGRSLDRFTPAKVHGPYDIHPWDYQTMVARPTDALTY